MKINPIVIFIGLLITTFSFSCDEKVDPQPSPVAFPPLTEFSSRFVAEAKARGYNPDLSDMDITYVDERISFNGRTFCGYGFISHPITGKRTVLISKSPDCGWASLSDLKREQFFFHEIGHAFLNLRHDESLLCDGKPSTLMNSNVDKYDYYSGSSEAKKYYLDELFDRLKANSQCLQFQDWKTNPVFYKHAAGSSDWFFSNSKETMAGSRPGNSLKISSIEGRTSQESGYWFTQIDVPNIPEGSKVTLRTKVNAQNLTGPGIAIALRVYESDIQNKGAQFRESLLLTTEASPVSGNLNNHVLQLSIPKFTRKTIYLIPFAVMMPGTKGEATFDEFEIVVE
jgi:hypothetical protein